MTTRQAFELWMLSIEHPVIGWISKEWFERGDNGETYANEYVQGAWVTYEALTTSQESRLCEEMKAAKMIPIDELIKGSPLDAFRRHRGVVDLESFSQWVEMERRQFTAMHARFDLENKESHEMYDWNLAKCAAFSEVMINLRAATDAGSLDLMVKTPDHKPASLH
jgi:hypothetical protein